MKIERAGIVELFTNLRCLPKLQKLDLSNNDLGQSIEILIRNIMFAPELNFLNLCIKYIYIYI